jgi:DNA recombination protein RmuC
MNELIFSLIGLVVGGGIIYVFMTIRNQGRHAVLEERITSLQNDHSMLRGEINGKEKQILELNTRLATSMTDLKDATEKLQLQKQEIQEIQDIFKTEFKVLANEILDDKTKKFTEVTKSKLEEILNPLREKIRDFEKKVEETYDKEAQQRFSLKEEVKKLDELNQQVSHEAQSLTKALKGESKTQGNRGEMILESILEESAAVPFHYQYDFSFNGFIIKHFNKVSQCSANGLFMDFCKFPGYNSFSFLSKSF